MELSQQSIIQHYQEKLSIYTKILFLATGYNKAGLATQYTDVIIQSKEDIPGNISMYISGGKGETTCQVSNSSIGTVNDLKSNIEEADARLILHCITASKKGAKNTCM